MHHSGPIAGRTGGRPDLPEKLQSGRSDREADLSPPSGRTASEAGRRGCTGPSRRGNDGSGQPLDMADMMQTSSTGSPAAALVDSQ